MPPQQLIMLDDAVSSARLHTILMLASDLVLQWLLLTKKKLDSFDEEQCCCLILILSPSRYSSLQNLPKVLAVHLLDPLQHVRSTRRLLLHGVYCDSSI